MTRSGPQTSLWRSLKSRRLAIVLLLAVAVYASLGTVVPRGGPESREVREWSSAHPRVAAAARLAGLDRAYASPVFLALAGILALSTLACALERTRSASRMIAASRALSTASIDRLRTSPKLAFEVASGTSPQDAMDRARSGLRAMGVRTVTRDGVTDGRAGVWGAFGSPLFHWSLFLLIVVVAAGQATRAEGYLGLPLGETVADAHDQYLQLTEGPLFRERHTGLRFEASDVVTGYAPGGVDVGPAPMLTVFRDGVEVASGRIYPNHPLRVGRILVHMVDVGPTAVLGLETALGAEVSRQTFLFERSEGTSSGTIPQEFALTAPGGEKRIEGRMQVAIRVAGAATSSPVQSRAVLETRTAGGTGYGAPTGLTVGEALLVGEGQRLRLADVGDWARVSVANDWSVEVIYSLFVSTLAGLAVAVLVPHRRVRLLVVEKEGRFWVHAVVRDSRGDPVFSERVENVVRRAAGTESKS